MSAEPNNPLLTVAIAHLTPLFLPAAGHDQAQASAAARDAIAEFGARSGFDVLLVAQVVAFSVAAIATAVQSASPGLPPEEKSRLQGRANALGRSADRSRKALARFDRHSASAGRAATQPETPDRGPDWAAAFAQVAQDVVANMPRQTPEQRRTAAAQAAGLNHAARSLNPPMPPSAQPPARR